MFSLSFSDGTNDLIPSVLPILVKGGKLFLVLSILDSCPNNSFSYNLLNSLNSESDKLYFFLYFKAFLNNSDVGT